jgi:hypothetical protein
MRRLLITPTDVGNMQSAIKRLMKGPQKRGSRVSNPTFPYTSKINLLQRSTANVKARFSPEAKR